MFKQLIVTEDGQGMTEYALILALVAMAIVIALIQVSVPLNAFYESVKDAFRGGSGEVAPAANWDQGPIYFKT